MADMDHRPHDGEDNNDDEEEEIDETSYKTVKDAVLLAIEISQSMLTAPTASDSKKKDNSSPALAALQCAYHLMQQRIISDPKAMMGILLYGTEESKFHGEEENSRGGLSYPHCYLLTDLDVPEADDVKTLKRIVEGDSAEATTILKPSKSPVSMSNVLFCSNQIFTTKAPNFSSRRLFIVTDNDNPHSADKALRSSAAVRAKDLYDLGVIIELFPISSPSHTFDTKIFYDDIIYRSSPTDPDAPAYNPTVINKSSDLRSGTSDGITLLQSLLSNISSKSTPQRTIFSSVPLELAPNLRISVKGYLLFKRQLPARSCYIYLGSDRPQLAKGTTTQLADDSTRTVEKFEIRKAFTFGGEQISFTPDEIKNLRNFGDPIIRLIGFKPIDMLPSWANSKHSTFLYPSEDDFVGSTRVFSALYQKLLTSQLMALTWFIARRNAAPVIAALIPTLAASPSHDVPTVDSTSASATGFPQGLYLIPLPFADDIRQNPPMPQGDTPLRAPDSFVDLMRPIIQQLQLPKGIFDPNRYPNPSLQWFYRILQAIALDEDLPEKGEDKTVPKYKQIDKRVGNEVVEWGIELDKVHREHAANNPHAGTSVLAKRPATARGDDGPSKRVKTEAGEVVSEQEMRKLWEKGQVGKLTVQQLKDWCGAKKLGMGGKKAELVERIESWLETR